MTTLTALYDTLEVADRVRAELRTLDPKSVEILSAADAHAVDRIRQGVRDEAQVADRQAALQDGKYLVIAEVADDKRDMAERILHGAGHALNEDELRERNPDGAAIAPAGEPAGAVGATSTIGLADDGRTTLRDPMKPREG